MQPLKISSSLNLHAYPLDDISEYIHQGLLFQKKMGFEAADFPMGLIAPLGDDWAPCIDKSLADADATGIRFEVCHLPFSVKICTHPEEMAPFCEKMHRSIDAAARLGVDFAVLHPNTTTVPLDQFDRKAQFESVTAHLSPFVEHADRVNVNIVVENMRYVPGRVPTHRYCQDPDEVCEVADALGIGICWDFGHANIGKLKQSKALHFIGSRLKVIHVNDNLGVGDDHLPPFCGSVDWKDAMKGLSDIGFSGLFNYEVAGRGRSTATRESFARYLVDSARELMSYFPEMP